MTEFLLDEDVLGLDRYLENHVKFRKVGGVNCPPKGATDVQVVKYAKENNLVIVTRDKKTIEQCNFENLKYVTYDEKDFAKKIINHSITDSFD